MTTRFVAADLIRSGSGIVGDALLIRDGRVAAVGWAADLREPGHAERHLPGCTYRPRVSRRPHASTPLCAIAQPERP